MSNVLKMKITRETARLVCDIENIIGNWVWNGQVNYGEGDFIRYPVWINRSQKENKTNQTTSTWKKISFININDNIPEINPEDIDSLQYRFGANELEIGTAIINALKFLEKRYGIDFAQMEKQISLCKTINN